MLSPQMLRRGSEEAPAERLELQAGPLKMAFEPDEVFLRYICLGEVEVLRGIYAGVRDHNWDTVPPRLTDLDLEERRDGGFCLRFEVDCKERQVDFLWRGTIEAFADGRLRFAIAGEARTAFRRNRIGFCVLHPIACAGKKVRVEKVGGQVEEGVFPLAISPHQPFMDMAAISHQIEGNIWARVEFAGDVFEMEDQRNWTDASYKTYCTPLAIPFPVDLAAGDRVEQVVELSFEGPVPTSPDSGSPAAIKAGRQVVQIDLQPQQVAALPQIGLGAASHNQALDEGAVERLRALNLAHLRVDLHLGDAACGDVLKRVSAEAERINLPLQVALFLSADSATAAQVQLQQLAALLEEVQPRVCAWLVFHESEKSTTGQWVELARPVLRRYAAEVPLGAGSDAYFTELNRERPPVHLLDLVSYSPNPQVHAFDDASLVETLQVQAITLESARKFAEGRPLVVGPVTLSPRFNPNATGPEPEPEPGTLPSQVDHRQLSLLGAGWTLGSVKYLAAGGASSVTYYEISGWRGVGETAAGSPLPEVFPSLPGGVFPLYHVLADIGEFAGGQVVSAPSSAPLKAEALVLRRAGRTRGLVANLSPQPQSVQLAASGDQAQVRYLDERHAAGAMADPATFRADQGSLIQTGRDGLALDLLPYAVARVDWL